MSELSTQVLTLKQNEFMALPLEKQEEILAYTVMFQKKLKQFELERRKAIEKILPDEGVKNDNYSISWQANSGRWILDEDKLCELFPEKTTTKPVIDPIFAETYFKKAKEVKPGEPLPEGVSYIVGEGRKLVIRTK